MSKTAIKVEDVSKNFKIPHEKHNSLKSAFASILKKKNYTQLKALEDISFEINKGEFFGILGKNGSGKSTLLKILAGIYVPDRGGIKIEGRLSPFIEVGVGFNPELTARENIFLNGALLGMSRKEIESKFDEIISFAELEDFIDMKLKNFSSGMQVRLAFSVAIQAHAEILLIDEVLAVGDAKFQEKCFSVFRKLKAEKKTIVLVTHDMGGVKEFCDRAMVIEKAKVETIGSVERAIQRYKEINKITEEVTYTDEEKARWGNFKAKIKEIKITDSNDREKKVFKTGDDLKITIKYDVKEKIENPNFGFSIFREDGVYVYDINTDLDKISPSVIDNKGKISLTYKNLPLQKGKYFFKLGIYKDYSKEVIDFMDIGPTFTIMGEKQFGLMAIEHEWSQ